MFGEISLASIVVLIVVLLVSMSIHEAMHAFVGLKLGDDTAAEQGRVSLNPLKHIDPFMTVLLPIITLIVFHAPILAAKPVPFNPDRVKYGEFGAALIAAAGPVSNLLLAIIVVIIVRLTGVDLTTTGGLGGDLAYTFIALNVSLFVFNLIPVPPLDGSRVLYAFAPEGLQRLMRQLEPYGLFVIFGLILAGGGVFISKVIYGLLNFLLRLT